MRESIFGITYFIFMIILLVSFTILIFLFISPIIMDTPPTFINLNTNRYKFNSQITDVYITSNNKVFVKQTIDIKNCISLDSNINRIRESIFYCPFYSIYDHTDGLSLNTIGNY